MLIVGAGSIAVTVQWVLNHIFIVAIIIVGKTFLLFGGLVFEKGQDLLHKLLVAAFIIADIVRNGYFFACIIHILGDMFSGGLWGFIIGIISIIGGGLFLLCAAEVPMYPVYDNIGLNTENKDLKMYIVLEIVAVIALVIVSLWGGVWEA